MTMTDLIASTDELPRANLRVVAWLEGFQEHSGVRWERKGWAFMVRHPDETSSVADGWSRSFYEDALKDLGADSLFVTSWFRLPAPPNIDALESAT